MLNKKRKVMKKGSMKKIKEKILFIISKYIYIFEFILCLIEASLIFSEIINKTEEHRFGFIDF